MANLLTRVPKRAQPGVATMVRTIYQQLSPAEVHGQLDRMVEQLREPFPQVAELLADAAPEILAFTAFPSVPLAEAVVQQPTGTAEPRDTAPQSLPPKGDVVGIFPNRLSARRRAGGVLAKQHDEWAAARPKGKSGGTEFAQRLLCPTAIITLLLNHFDAQFGSPNIHYVQQRVRERRLSRSERPLAHVRFRRYCRPAGGPRNRFPQRVVPIWIPVNPGCAMRR